MADLLEEAVEVMQARAAPAQGRTRQHTPTADEPLIVVVVDELASLTAYAERDDQPPHQRRPVHAAVPGPRGRRFVVAALQDPRKEVLPFRDLFPTRIALRLTEPEQTDLVLGPGARVRGADCARIPLTTPGVGCVVDGEPEPARVRAGWVSDADIAAMVAAFTPGAPPPPLTTARWSSTSPTRPATAGAGAVSAVRVVSVNASGSFASWPPSLDGWSAGSRAEEAKKSRPRGAGSPRLVGDFFAVP